MLLRPYKKGFTNMDALYFYINGTYRCVQLMLICAREEIHEDKEIYDRGPLPYALHCPTQRMQSGQHVEGDAVLGNKRPGDKHTPKELITEFARFFNASSPCKNRKSAGLD